VPLTITARSDTWRNGEVGSGRVVRSGAVAAQCGARSGHGGEGWCGVEREVGSGAVAMVAYGPRRSLPLLRAPLGVPLLRAWHSAASLSSELPAWIRPPTGHRWQIRPPEVVGGAYSVTSSMDPATGSCGCMDLATGSCGGVDLATSSRGARDRARWAAELSGLFYLLKLFMEVGYLTQPPLLIALTEMVALRRSPRLID
jgi:hypothetical protein